MRFLFRNIEWLRTVEELFTLLSVRRRMFFVSVAFSAGAGLLQLAELRVLYVVVNVLVRNGMSEVAVLSRNILFAVIALFLISSFSGLLSYVSRRFVLRQMEEADTVLKSRVFSRLLELGKQFFDERGYSHLHSLIIRKTEMVTAQLQNVHTILSQSFFLLAYAVVLFVLSPVLATLSVIIVGFMITLHAFIAGRFRKVAIEEEASKGRIDRQIFQSLSGIPLVQSHSQEDAESDRFKELSSHEAKIRRSLLQSTEATRQVWDMGTTVALLLIAASMAWVIPAQAQEHASRFLLFFFVMRQAFASCSRIGDALFSYNRSLNGFNAIKGVLGESMKRYIPSAGVIPFTGLMQGVTINDLSFSYASGAPVLHNVSFTIPRGKITAIVGTTGSGKTTLMHLLMRFYDCPEHSIFIDGTDIRHFSLKSLRSNIAFMSQDVFMFDTSLRHNIAYGSADAEESMLRKAVERAYFHTVVDRLPDGWDTEMGDRGVMLSGGERQRAALARAFLKNADMWILDEPSSALDIKTEQHIHRSLQEAKGEKTILIVSHRLSTIKYADHIVVLDEGRVVEQGSFSELLAHKNLFYEYWESQRLDDVLERQPTV